MDETHVLDYTSLDDEEKIEMLVDQSQVLYDFASLLVQLDKKFGVLEYLQDEGGDVDILELSYEAVEFYGDMMGKDKKDLH
tara:strand:+ start:7652 stop:7894 length:243 start_codon:yes stop_codon:yes gene_type:complete